MDQQLFIKAGQVSEGYDLGERYHLGELQSEHYITYTDDDVHRYRFQMLLIVAIALYLAIIFAIFLVENPLHNVFPFVFFTTLINIFIIPYSASRRRKWGNRPLISPRNRQLRVYVYQDGMVKQTNQKSEVIRWSDLYTIKYEPLQQRPVTTSRPMAGIKLVLRNNRRITLNGALSNIDILAQWLNSKNQTHRGVSPKTD
jgi:hypothetical protein